MTNIRSSDSAFIPVFNNVSLAHNTILDNGNNTHTVNGIMPVSDLTPGTDVSLYGAYTESDGKVLFTNATIVMNLTDPIKNKYTLLNQIIANFQSVKGDSGGPVVHAEPDGTLKMVGLHMGTACNFTPKDFKFPVLPYNCLEEYKKRDKTDNEGKAYLEQTGTPQFKQLKVFSPWEYVTSELDLR